MTDRDASTNSSGPSRSTAKHQPPEPPVALPNAETAYLEQIVKTLQSRLDRRLVGVYLFGSAATGNYEPGISDLDVQAVVGESPAQHECVEIARRLAHAALPCPARRLEFVVYAQRSINPAAHPPRFEMNFNTGAGERDHLSLDPAEEASHCFVLDIAMGREFGRSLVGPAPAQVFAPLPRPWCLQAIADSLAWHRQHELTSANRVLNACRGWRYAVTGELGSKLAGAAWARRRPECPPVVVQAEQRRRGGPEPDAPAVMELVSIVDAAVQAALLLDAPRPTTSPM